MQFNSIYEIQTFHLPKSTSSMNFRVYKVHLNAPSSPVGVYKLELKMCIFGHFVRKKSCRCENINVLLNLHFSDEL